MNPTLSNPGFVLANYILYFEIVLMSLFLLMNATDASFQSMDSGNVISQFIAPWFSSLPESTLHIIERSAWWIHILGILIFLKPFFCIFFLNFGSRINFLISLYSSFEFNLFRITQ